MKIKKTFLSIKRKLNRYLSKLGPGLITGVSDDDPSGIATYSQAGAAFGFGLLWTALITYPLMFAIQEMCARIGIVCSTGLAGVLRLYYPKGIIYSQLFLVIPAIILNIAANLSGMSAVANLLIPTVPPFIFSFIFTVIITLFLVFLSYKKIASVLKYLCLSFLCYFIVPFLININWKDVVYSTFIPEFQRNKEYYLLLVAVLGTTISPYLFFWQASMSFEQNEHNKQKEIQEIKEMKTDVNVGMLLSNLIMFFIILTTGSVLFPNGIHQIQTVKEAAQALEPLAGEFAYLFFSIGILGVGFLSIPILAACIGYIFSETYGWKKGLDRKVKEAKEFYFMIIIVLILGMAITFFGIDPIKLLILTAIIYGLITPILILLIIHICNSKEIMGIQTNSTLSNILGLTVFLLMTLSIIIFAYYLIK